MIYRNAHSNQLTSISGTNKIVLDFRVVKDNTTFQKYDYFSDTFSSIQASSMYSILIGNYYTFSLGVFTSI